MQMYVEYLCSCSFPLFVCNHIYYIIPLFIEDTSGRAPTLSLMESGTTILQFPCVDMSVASQGSTWQLLSDLTIYWLAAGQHSLPPSCCNSFVKAAAPTKLTLALTEYLQRRLQSIQQIIVFDVDINIIDIDSSVWWNG